MYTMDVMSFLDSVSISLMGLATVMICLMVLAVMILLFSKIFAVVETGEKAEAVHEETGIDEEAYAVLISAISEETRLPMEQFRITSIKEL